MKLKPPINKNYCATIVELDRFVELENCDNVKHAIIFGNSVIVSKDTGKIPGVFFPLETQLSNEFLKVNNLYRKAELNDNPNIKGYFEENGRIRCVKFRGYKSEGFFIPLGSIAKFASVKEVIEIPIGTEFDEINGVKICEKYVIKKNLPGSPKQKEAVKRISRLVPNQFRLHTDTDNLRKYISKLKPEDIVTLSYKMHGTSFVTANILTKRKLKLIDKISKFFGATINDTIYDIVYSSRKVVKNEFETKDHNHFYGYDLWNDIKEILKPVIEKGITLYGEAVGYLKTGEMIQKGFDYGCKMNEFNTYIYRITSTNEDGKVIEFTETQIDAYCKKYGLNRTPLIYHGKLKDLFPISTESHWHDTLLKMLEDKYLEGDCYMCVNKVPAEGIVIKLDKAFDFEAYKLKSFRFLEMETKNLDKGEIDIESEQS